jgi:hypothetical protein
VKNSNLRLVSVSFVVGFVLTLGLASIANAQDRIEPPADAHNVCINAISRLAEGGITDDELMEIENVCVYAESAGLNYLETLMDNLNGSQPRPSFGTWAEAMAHMNRCHHVDDVICPNEGTVPDAPVAEVPREPRRLVVEGRGAVARMEGRGWNRQVVCEEGTVPFNVEERYAHVDGESRRRIERRTTLVIVYCLDPDNLAAPRIAEREGTVDLTEIYARLDRLENACGTDGMRGHSEEWDLLCTRFDAVLIHTTEINGLRTDLTEITSDLEALSAREDRRWAADCGKTDAEWTAMSEDERLELIRSGQCDGASTTVVHQSDWHLGFHLGLAFHGLGITAPAGILAPHGVVYAEIEALPVEHFGFFLRGYVGAGNLLDRIGQFNPDGTIGDEGIFGGSVGPTFRFNEMFALDVGLAASAVFNPGGQIGRSLHTWPVFQLGGEVRLRVNPLPWLHIEGTAGLDYSHAEVRRPNVDHFVGVDGVGYVLSLGGGVSF